jgi:hypothetical protein
MIKTLFTSLLVFYSSFSVGENTIVGLYNDNVITLNQLNNITNGNDSKEKKILAIQTLISEKIEMDFINKLKIVPTTSSINDELLKIANNNNISFEQLKQIANFDEIYSIVILKLSKIGLRQIIINKDKADQISINSAEGISLYQNWLKNTKEKMYIEIFEDKL